MISIDPMLLQAFRYSHVRTVYITVYSGYTALTEPMQILASGSVRADRNQRARRQLTASIPLSQWEDVPDLNVISSRVLVEMGFDLGATSVVLPLGLFRVNELSRNNAGELQLSGTSMESYVIEDAFEKETTYPIGTNCLDKLKAVITETLPEARFEIAPVDQRGHRCSRSRCRAPRTAGTRSRPWRTCSAPTCTATRWARS